MNGTANIRHHRIAASIGIVGPSTSVSNNTKQLRAADDFRICRGRTGDAKYVPTRKRQSELAK
jgi:hypothetical protein